MCEHSYQPVDQLPIAREPISLPLVLPSHRTPTRPLNLSTWTSLRPAKRDSLALPSLPLSCSSVSSSSGSSSQEALLLQTMSFPLQSSQEYARLSGKVPHTSVNKLMTSTPLSQQAVAVLNGETVSGTVTFTQPFPTAPVTISGEVKNLRASAEHGFHIQYVLASSVVGCLPPAHATPASSASGDLSNGCISAGPHFNPFEVTHGAPSDPPQKRHVGDLGNIKTSSQGIASISLEDPLISLNGPMSIIG